MNMEAFLYGEGLLLNLLKNCSCFENLVCVLANRSPCTTTGKMHIPISEWP